MTTKSSPHFVLNYSMTLLIYIRYNRYTFSFYFATNATLFCCNKLRFTFTETSSVHLRADEVEDVLLVAAAVIAACSSDSGMAADGSVAAEMFVVVMAPPFAVGSAHPAGHSDVAAGGVDDDDPYQDAVVHVYARVLVAAAAVALTLPAQLLTSATSSCTTQLLLL